MEHSSPDNLKINTPTRSLVDARLDLEIYVMGEMKLEFISFLSECFKDNLNETLSWGNFRRFQLLLNNKKNWINVYFIVLNNEVNADVLINSFKIYEKRNFTLLVYNANDQKSEKHIDSLSESLIFERNKFYEGILNEDSIHKNIKRISSEILRSNVKVSQETIKAELKFLTENEENLIYKIGFVPNVINKKTKNVKKSDGNTSYDIEQELFYFSKEEEEIKTDFAGLMTFLLKENFKKFKLGGGMTNFLEVINFNPKVKQKDKTKSRQKEMMGYLVKAIDWLIIIYIVVSFYKFLMDRN